MQARPATEKELRSSELLYGGLDLPDLALARIAELSDRPEEIFHTAGGWAAVIDLEGTAVIAMSEGDRWSFACPPGTDEADAMQAARTLHGRIAKQSEDWDLDR